jgi:polyisoprenoid-binding protein YceI
MKIRRVLFVLLPVLGWTGLTAGAAERLLVIDRAQSRVEIEVKATVDSFTGKLDAYEARVELDEAGERVTGARVTFHFRDVHTGNADRDTQMHAWQDTAHHPDGVFTLASLTETGGGGFLAKGTLALHDVAREIAFPVAVRREGGRHVIDGDAVVDTRDFGLSIIKKFLLLKVEPVVHVKFHLEGASAAEAARETAAKS